MNPPADVGDPYLKYVILYSDSNIGLSCHDPEKTYAAIIAAGRDESLKCGFRATSVRHINIKVTAKTGTLFEECQLNSFAIHSAEMLMRDAENSSQRKPFFPSI